MPKSDKPANGRAAASKTRTAAKAAARNTDSGPARVQPDGADRAAARMAQVEALAAQMPNNPTKPAEHGYANAIAPQRGATAEPESRMATGSTLSEENGSRRPAASRPKASTPPSNRSTACASIRAAAC